MNRRVLTPLVPALAVLTLAACGGDDTDESTDTTEAVSDTTEAAGADSTEAAGADTTEAAGADTTEAAADDSAAPAADGLTISGTGYSYTVPSEWSEESAPGADSVAVDMTDTDGFAQNVNVVTDSAIVTVGLDQVEEASRPVLEQNGVTEIEFSDGPSIDGEPSVYGTALFNQSGVEYRTEQYYVIHDDTGYVITFSHDEDSTPEERAAIDEPILASFTWG